MSNSLQFELDRLNPEQRQAVMTTEGYVLVLAGAGSGKTRVLTLRIAYLVLYKQVSPDEIVALTFTNKAAGEMKERLVKLIGNKLASKVFIGTFHSYALHVLRDHIEHLGFTKNFSLYSEADIKRIFKQLAASYLDQSGELPPLDKSFQVLQMSKTLGEAPKDTENKWHDAFLKACHESLKISMRAFNAVDFDGLLQLTCELLEHHTEVMRPYLEKTRYVLVDEYQDSNMMQFKIATGLAQTHKNLFVVGDDDQSIYGWRGAKIENILQFPANVTIKLEQNYRSSPTILEAANSVIGHNKKRHSKRLKSNSSHDQKITVFHAPSDLDEAQTVVLKLLKIKQEMGLKFSDFAILYRSNALSRAFELSLSNMVYPTPEGLKKGIPYVVYGGLEFFERAEIKDLTALLNICLNPKDQESLLRMINVPRRGLSDKTLDKITSFQRKEAISLFETLVQLQKLDHPLRADLSEKALASLKHFTGSVQKAQSQFHSKAPFFETLKTLLEDLNYKEAIKEDVKSDKMRAFKQESVDLYIENLKNFQENQPGQTLFDFVALNTLDDSYAGEKRHSKDAVSLMTLHSSKGLEFEVCFLVGLEDHILPHEKSLKQSSLEEERRLFYVGLTRGKKQVVLSMAKNRSRMGKAHESAPSRFLFEIPQGLLDIVSYQSI